MSGGFDAARLVLRRHFPHSAVYQGSGGMVWFAGFVQAAPSIAAFFCGDDVRPGPRRRARRHRVPHRIVEIAGAGGLAIVQLGNPNDRLAGILSRAVAVPTKVDIDRPLPADLETLRAQLVTSTTREDFRRIRRANFGYRITSDPEAVREFHARHYAPVVARRFPEDGQITPISRMVGDLDQGGELVCADIDGEWVAGMFNLRHEESYALRSLGIRDADDAIRNKRVVSALIVRSLERAVELGKARASLGRSLPFLGKSSVWFKVKWGGVVTRRPDVEHMHMFMDLRHPAVRRMLSASPVIHSEGDDLVVSAWLEPGDKPLRALVRESQRVSGIARWYVLAHPETLSAGGALLPAADRIVPVPLTPQGHRPLWLGEVLSGSAAPA